MKNTIYTLSKTANLVKACTIVVAVACATPALSNDSSYVTQLQASNAIEQKIDQAFSQMISDLNAQITAKVQATINSQIKEAVRKLIDIN